MGTATKPPSSVVALPGEGAAAYGADTRPGG